MFCIAGFFVFHPIISSCHDPCHDPRWAECLSRSTPKESLSRSGLSRQHEVIGEKKAKAFVY